MFRSKKYLTVVSITVLVLSFAVIAICGNRYTGTYAAAPWDADPASFRAEDYYVTAEDPEIVEVTQVRTQNGRLAYDLKALKRGITYLEIGSRTEGFYTLQKIYVHRLGIITEGTYFGRCSGGIAIPLSILVILLFLYADCLTKLRDGIRESLYTYRNIINLGVFVFMTFLIVQQVRVALGFQGIDAAIGSVMTSAENFTTIVLPVAAVVFALISLSNISLMRKEGVNWRNMLGFILGIALCLMTVLPGMLYGFLLRHQIVDIFNEQGIGAQLFSILEHSIFTIVAYMECLLVGTVVFGIRAARHIPAFDKDYILILGSQIRADGTLPPLLRSRADKAVECAGKQKEATGKEIVFVPSGGQGGDEVMAEADAIGNYLASAGVPEERILRENRSRSTYENIRNSMLLIREDYAAKAGGNGTEEAKAAFSTTNYHVFRAGLIAYEQGYRMEGIGSPTKRYFWINAFIREFIATLSAEKKEHMVLISILLAGVLLMAAVRYLSVIL